MTLFELIPFVVVGIGLCVGAGAGYEMHGVLGAWAGAGAGVVLALACYGALLGLLGIFLRVSDTKQGDKAV